MLVNYTDRGHIEVPAGTTAAEFIENYFNFNCEDTYKIAVIDGRTNKKIKGADSNTVLKPEDRVVLIAQGITERKRKRIVITEEEIKHPAPRKSEVVSELKQAINGLKAALDKASSIL